jgi:hypothetical protein
MRDRRSRMSLRSIRATRYYASGTGLMSGATFGRLAGRSAAGFAKM